MADSRTAITCPHHADCELVILSCPEGELNGRKRQKYAMWLDPWIPYLGGRVILALDHHEAPPRPGPALLKIAKDERAHVRLEAATTELKSRSDQAEVIQEEAARQLEIAVAKLARLERFVTRTKHLRKKWDKNG